MRWCFICIEQCVVKRWYRCMICYQSHCRSPHLQPPALSSCLSSYLNTLWVQTHLADTQHAHTTQMPLEKQNIYIIIIQKNQITKSCMSFVCPFAIFSFSNVRICFLPCFIWLYCSDGTRKLKMIPLVLGCRVWPFYGLLHNYLKGIYDVPGCVKGQIRINQSHTIIKNDCLRPWYTSSSCVLQVKITLLTALLFGASREQAEEPRYWVPTHIPPEPNREQGSAVDHDVYPIL